MKPKLLLRIVAGLVLFFAVGHSIGHFTRKTKAPENVKAVIKAMETETYDFHGSIRSYDIFFEGMSLNLIITLLALTVLFWILASGAEKAPGLVKSLLWPLVFALGAFAVTSFMFFFMVPGVTCLLAAVLTLLVIFRLPSSESGRV